MTLPMKSKNRCSSSGTSFVDSSSDGGGDESSDFTPE